MLGPGGGERGSRLQVVPGAREPASVAAYLMQEATALLGAEEPLRVEVFASVVAGIAYRCFASQPEAEGTFWADLLWAAEREGSPRALALLLALAALIPHRAAIVARDAASRLLRRSTTRPPWAGTVGRARFAGAWRLAPSGCDREVVVLCAQHPGRTPHALFVLLDRRRWLALDAGLSLDAARALAESARTLPGTEILPISRATAVARLVGALAAADAGRWSGELTDDFCDLRALIAVRVAGPSPPTPDRDAGAPSASPVPLGAPTPTWPPSA
jgi:hypothetical protein